MIKEEIEKTFHLGQKLPKGVVDICDYLDKNGYPISGCFELSTIGMDDMRHWFKNSPESVDLLMPFGRGACGDVYALWLTNNLKPEEAPVVMFGSEGELTVLAKNANEFCMLLCLGYSELGLDNHGKVGADYEKTQPFREYIQNIYNFQLPQTAEETINQAKQIYPNFQSWVEKNAWQ